MQEGHKLMDGTRLTITAKELKRKMILFDITDDNGCRYIYTRDYVTYKFSERLNKLVLFKTKEENHILTRNFLALAKYSKSSEMIDKALNDIHFVSLNLLK
jgi:hypothetical protein